MHLDSFRFNVIPNTYTQITAVTRKMIFMQLWRDKTYPMDPWTFSEVMELSIGPPPQGAKNQLEEWMAWMDILKQIQGEAEQGGGKEGRPPSGQQPPHLKARTNGSSTVAESK